MTVSEKIKTVDNKIEKSQSQYGLERQATKTSALTSRNVGKSKF